MNERDRVEELIDQIMIEEFEVEPKKLARGASLVKDLDLDSLDGVDLVVALEKTFHCRIPEDEVKKIRTLGDIYDKIQAMLSAQGQAPTSGAATSAVRPSA